MFFYIRKTKNPPVLEDFFCEKQFCGFMDQENFKEFDLIFYKSMRVFL